ncbi:hypothetical protein [Streptomyces acidiscabies]|uniref:hypothetical protein n=1 Tax=Streptomyces acidiscabies TaxID=42234 RepID=UPI0038F6E5EC
MSAHVRTAVRLLLSMVIGVLALLVLVPSAHAVPTPDPSPSVSSSPSEDPCALIPSEAKKYCERGQQEKNGNPVTPPAGVSDTLDPMSSLARACADGAAWVVDRLSDAVIATAEIDFTNASFRSTYALVFAASTFIVLLIWLWAVIKRAVRGVPLTRAIGEAVGLLWMTVLASAFTPLALYVVISAVDGVTEILAGGSQHAKLFDSFSGALKKTQDGGPVVTIALSLVSMAAAGVLWIELVVRTALLYAGALFGTIMYAGLVDKDLWGKVRRWVGIMAALILIKPLVVIVMRLSSTMTSGSPGDGISVIVSGLAIILIGIIASALIFRMVPGMGDEIVAARRDSYDPASRQSAAIVTKPVTGISQGINTHAARDAVVPRASSPAPSSASQASGGIAAHSSRPTSSAPPTRQDVPNRDGRGGS